MRALLLLVPIAAAACGARAQDAVPIESTGAVATLSQSQPRSAAPFDRYRTFGFIVELPPSGYDAGARGVRGVQRRRNLETAVAALLVEKGYAPSSGPTDFTIALGVGQREFELHDMIDDDSLPQGAHTAFVEGAVVADVFDASTGTLVWHGTTRAQIDPARMDAVLLRRSVQALLSSFPAASDIAQ